MHSKKIAAIEKFADLRILVLGDIMLDIFDFCHSNESRPSPEKFGTLVYKARTSVKTLGGAGNVAANLAALNVATSFISICGEDGNRAVLQNLADELGILHTFIADPCRPTTTKTRLYIDDDYILRRDDEETGEVDADIAERITNAFTGQVDGVDAVILSDYNKGFFTAANTRTFIDVCRAQSIPVIVDFKPPNRSYFSGADIIAPNDVEAEVLQPGFCQSDDLEAETRKLYDLLACDHLVVTLGARGICGFDGTSFFHVPVNKVEVVDSVGCGDTVRVGMALGFALGLDLREAALLANAAAAVVIQKLGVATLTRAELRDFINSLP
jgi:D-beta-D-heptose 7-phosphate kinase/D-beta-D-heptose 1-phosphate adenosyltransferase